MNKAVNMVDLEGDEFADYVLSQPPVDEQQEVNSIRVDQSQKNGGNKLTYTQMPMLVLLTFCCLMGPAAAAPVQAAIQVSAIVYVGYIISFVVLSLKIF